MALHLALQTLVSMSSVAALPLSRRGSLPWNPALAARASALNDQLADIDPDAFADAVDAEVRRRTAAFADGVGAYRRHPYRRRLKPPPAVWAEGTTRLRDYGRGGRGPAVLVVPSLVNRAYVLDLTVRRSLLRYLGRRGFRPLLVDWDAPGEAERSFTLSDYIAGRLQRALAVAVARSGGPVAVIGYCMGGNLALALAQRNPDTVSALALLATPWDFSAIDPARRPLLQATTPRIAALVGALGVMPVDGLQALFAGLDPFLALRKFQRFGRTDPASDKARDFVALEDWLNDGVALAGPVAEECLTGWYGANTPPAGTWSVAGRPVRPAEIAQPTLVVVPRQDYIVPPAAALPLAAAIPGARLKVLPAGHIGMVVGRRAPRSLYGPLARWLEERRR